MSFSEKQQEFLQNCNHRWNIKTGATRSGKTFLDYTVIPKRILKCRGDGLIVLLGNTKGTLERNILEPMRSIWSPSLVGLISSNNTVNIFGKRCYALGADKVSQVSKLQGAAFEYCYGDEITTWHQDVFQMLKSRLSCPGSCFDGTCNPDNPHHWFKQFLDSGADIFQQAYTIDDNPFLDHGFVDALKAEYTGTVYYDRFILGRWKSAEGVVYRQFADDPARFITDEVPKIQMAVIGVDFGGNGSAHAFVCNGILPGWKGIVTLDEYYRKEVISPGQLEQDFIDFVRRCKERYPKIYEVYCDSAEQVLIQGLRAATVRAGLPIDIRNARKGPINDRIRFYCQLMGAGKYSVLRRCTHVIEALSTAVWNSKDPTKDERLDDGSSNIDSLDALEYSTEPYMADIIALMR
nr:MAG TPA: large terminase [Caudoviricetes sp.]